VRKVDLRQHADERLGAANKTVTRSELRNVGPSITYKLRDAAGQAREFHNYMLPVDMGDGQPVFLLGVRETRPSRSATCACRPTTGQHGRLLCGCARRWPTRRCASARRCAATWRARRSPADGPSWPSSWPCRPPAPWAVCRADRHRGGRRRPRGGLQAMSDFMEASVPEAERERAAEVLLRILNGSLFELAQLARERGPEAAGAQTKPPRPS
jgi:cytochrome c biogenesis protein